MAYRSRLPIRPSQALLFAPVALLALGAILVLRNGFARPVAHAEDSPDGTREILIFLEYPPCYPFTGDVRAILELRRLPEHRLILERELGAYRWARTATEEHKVVDWSVPGKIVLRSTDGKRAISIPFRDGEGRDRRSRD